MTWTDLLNWFNWTNKNWSVLISIYSNWNERNKTDNGSLLVRKAAWVWTLFISLVSLDSSKVFFPVLISCRQKFLKKFGLGLPPPLFFGKCPNSRWKSSSTSLDLAPPPFPWKMAKPKLKKSSSNALDSGGTSPPPYGQCPSSRCFSYQGASLSIDLNCSELLKLNWNYLNFLNWTEMI